MCFFNLLKLKIDEFLKDYFIKKEEITIYLVMFSNLRNLKNNYV